jgi:hypothetical protein
MRLFQQLTKQQWIEHYGGQALLDREGFEVIRCHPEDCEDPVCHGWRVRRKLAARSDGTAA